MANTRTQHTQNVLCGAELRQDNICEIRFRVVRIVAVSVSTGHEDNDYAGLDNTHRTNVDDPNAEYAHSRIRRRRACKPSLFARRLTHSNNIFDAQLDAPKCVLFVCKCVSVLLSRSRASHRIASHLRLAPRVSRVLAFIYIDPRSTLIMGAMSHFGASASCVCLCVCQACVSYFHRFAFATQQQSALLLLRHICFGCRMLYHLNIASRCWCRSDDFLAAAAAATRRPPIRRFKITDIPSNERRRHALACMPCMHECGHDRSFRRRARKVAPVRPPASNGFDKL